MLRIVLSVFIVVLTLDVIFQGGALMQEVLKTDLHIPFFIKVIVLVMVLAIIVLLYHSIVWEYMIKGPPEIVKTPLQLHREKIALELAAAEQEQIRLDDEERKVQAEERQRMIEEAEAKKTPEVVEEKVQKFERKDPTVVDYGQRKTKIVETGGHLEEPKQQWGVRGGKKKPPTDDAAAPEGGAEGKAEAPPPAEKKPWGVRGK